MYSYGAKKLTLLALAAIAASALTISLTPVYAQKHGGGGHSGGSSHSDTEHSDTEHADDGHSGGKGGKGGRGGVRGHGSGGGSQSLRDIFREIESESSASSEEHGSGSKGHSAATSRGKRGSASSANKGGRTTPKAGEVSEDSDRPAWAGIPGREGKPGSGNTASGTKKGDIYGDMYVLLRDPNGVPILKEVAPGLWVVQPVDATGNVLPLDAEGNLINPELAIAVELGRLNVSRSPPTVLSRQFDEVVKNINAADSVSVDASGRLVLITNGVAAAVDSPLANLALYAELLNKGTITGVTDPSKFTSNISYLVDGSFSPADFTGAASFLAAAADKASTLTIDKVVDINTILGISGTKTDSLGNGSYVDYSTFSYDRLSVYGGKSVEVLVKQPDGSYLPTSVSVYQAVFGSTNYTSPDGVDGFAQAADDARAVIEYIHDNSIPETN